MTSWPAEGMGIASSHGRIAIDAYASGNNALATGLWSSVPIVWDFGEGVVFQHDPLSISRSGFREREIAIRMAIR